MLQYRDKHILHDLYMLPEGWEVILATFRAADTNNKRKFEHLGSALHFALILFGYVWFDY